MFQKYIKILIIVAIAVAVLFAIVDGIINSDFSNLKKYDEGGKREKLKAKIAQKRRYSRKIKIEDNNIANLGDFTMNIAGDKKLITNISLKYKNNKNSSWIGRDNIEDEIIDKGDVLRSAVVGIITNRKNAKISNQRMKKELVNNMNNYLSHGEVQEVYFNRFIIQ